MLLTTPRAELFFGEQEVLAAAQHLTGKPGLCRDDPAPVTYMHMLFDRHQIVLANGCWSESFHPGTYSMNGLDAAQRTEILTIFPELASHAGRERHAAARRSLRRHETRSLIGADRAILRL